MSLFRISKKWRVAAKVLLEYICVQRLKIRLKAYIRQAGTRRAEQI